VRRKLTFTAAVAGGLVIAGAALWALADGERRPEPLLDPAPSDDRRNGAPRPVCVPVPERSTAMSTRFISNLLLATAGGFVIVATFAFAPPVVGWIAFGVTGVGVLVLVAATALVPGRGLVQRTLDGVVAVLAAWTIVESLVFNGSLMVWLSFGAAAAMVALAVAGLIAHELSTERVVHSLEDVRVPERHVESLS